MGHGSLHQERHCPNRLGAKITDRNYDARSRHRFWQLSRCSRQSDGRARPCAWRPSRAIGAPRHRTRTCHSARHLCRGGRKLEELDETLKPDAILHFGLAARRKSLSIETRALNRLNLLRCDASGARASRLAIIPGAPQAARSTFPARQIEAALRHAGLRARLSVKAGTYVCNESLYLTLTRSHAGAAGFIHVPRLARADRPRRASRNRRPYLAGLVRAALIAILVTARKRRHDLARHDCVKTPGKCPALKVTADP